MVCRRAKLTRNYLYYFAFTFLCSLIFRFADLRERHTSLYGLWNPNSILGWSALLAHQLEEALIPGEEVRAIGEELEGERLLPRQWQLFSQLLVSLAQLNSFPGIQMEKAR